MSASMMAMALRRGASPVMRSKGFDAGKVDRILQAEILELAGNNAKSSKKSHLVPRSVDFALRNDEKLSRILLGNGNGGINFPHKRFRN